MDGLEAFRPPCVCVPHDRQVRFDCASDDVRRTYPLLTARAGAWGAHRADVCVRNAHVRCHDECAHRAAVKSGATPPPPTVGPRPSRYIWLRVRAERFLVRLRERGCLASSPDSS